MPQLTALVLTLAVASPAAGDSTPIQHYEGTAYAASGSVLYTESHWVAQDGSRTVLYRCPAGQPFARKQVGDGSAAPDFELVDARAAYREGVRGQGDARQVFTVARGGKETAKAVPAHAAQVIDAGFDSYVRGHWDALVQHRDTQIAFMVPSRHGNLELKIQPQAGKNDTHQFTLALDAWYSAVAPTITVTYSNNGHRLTQFEGVGNIRDAKGDYPKVRIEFPASAVGTATIAQMQEATKVPLVDHCAG